MSDLALKWGGGGRGVEQQNITSKSHRQTVLTQQQSNVAKRISK
jgi:hypothetical protein